MYRGGEFIQHAPPLDERARRADTSASKCYLVLAFGWTQQPEVTASGFCVSGRRVSVRWGDWRLLRIRDHLIDLVGVGEPGRHDQGQGENSASIG